MLRARVATTCTIRDSAALVGERLAEDGVDVAHAAGSQAGLALEGSVELTDLAGIETLDRPVTQSGPDADLDEAAVLVHRLGRELVGDLVDPRVEQLTHGPLRSRRRTGVDLGVEGGQGLLGLPPGPADGPADLPLLAGQRVAPHADPQLPVAGPLLPQGPPYEGHCTVRGTP